MALEDAEKTVRQYGLVLATEKTAGPAYCGSCLAQPIEQIMQAMKLWLAHDIQNHCLTQEFRNEVGTAAGRLPFFVRDEDAHRINALRSDWSAEKRNDNDFVARAKGMTELHEWTTQAQIAGLSLRRELSDFIATVEQFDSTDPNYWKRVYALAGVSGIPICK